MTNGVPWNRRTETSYAQVWDARDGHLVQTINGHPGWVSEVRFTPDNRFMATAGYDKTTKLWDTRDWSLVRTFQGHTNAIDSLAVSPDGRRLVTGSWDGTVRLWDLETGQPLHQMRGHFGFVQRVAFSPDGQRVASGGHDGFTRLWDVNSGQEVLKRAGHTAWVLGVAFRPDGNQLVSTSNDGIRVWDATPVESDPEPIPGRPEPRRLPSRIRSSTGGSRTHRSPGSHPGRFASLRTVPSPNVVPMHCGYGSRTTSSRFMRPG